MKKKRYKSYHLIIIPHDKTHLRNIYFTAKRLKFLTFLSIIVISVFATLVTLHTRNYLRLRITLFPTITKNSSLSKENTEIKEEKKQLKTIIDSLTTEILSERAIHREKLKSLNMQAERVTKFAEDLRIMVGFKLEPAEAQPPGLGGPVPEDKKHDFLENQDVSDEEILSLFDNAEKTVLKKFISSRQKLKSLWQYFENKSSIIEGTPDIQPVPGKILSGFGYRVDPFSGRVVMHHGVDIPAGVGTKIKAPADGIVIFVGRRGGYGKCIEIDHGNNYKTIYGHLNSFSVAIGDRVKKGDYIAGVGNTGRSTGSHLHYEVRLNNVPLISITKCD